MPLSILVTLVVLGIAGIAVLTKWLGMSTPKQFQTEQDVIAAWAREFPETSVSDVTLCLSGNGALVTTARGPGLVWAMGADSTARLLSNASLTPRDTGLRIDLPDYSAPHVTLTLTKTETAQWSALIGASA